MTQRAQRGFSLVELMIGMTLGLLVVGSVLALFVSTLGSNRSMVGVHELQTQLYATVGLMARDLRRAGFNGKASPLAVDPNPFGLGSTAAYAGEQAASCLLFSYDLNDNGKLDTSNPDERMGYRLRHGVVQSRTGGGNCQADGWEAVTSASVVEVTELKFEFDVHQPEPANDMCIRRVHITLAGRLRDHPDVTRTVQRRVRVRNDLHGSCS